MTNGVNSKMGRLICVGTGINSTRQITAVAKYNMEHADVVFGVMPNTLIDNWIMGFARNYISLQSHYAHGKSRQNTYMGMAQTILDELRAGKDVCFALYGHPGIYAYVEHLAVGLAREAGFEARMEPGISAEDCLIADLGMDPSQYGCQSYETTKLLFYKHVVDPCALLIL